MSVTIVTNIPDVAALYPDISRCLEADVMHVFITLRDAIHKGARLVSHPLSGSVKPNVNPYKSVLLSDSEVLDYQSLCIIEDAIGLLKRLPGIKHDYSGHVMEDFRILDLDLIKGAISYV